MSASPALARFKQGASSALWAVAGIGLLVASFVLVQVFINGSIWAAAHIFPWLSLIIDLTLTVTLLILAPLTAIRRTRNAGLTGLYVASFIFGASVWFWSLLLTYILWGIGAVIVGLLIAGVGVLPIAMLATAFGGHWSTFFELVFFTLLTYGLRFLVLYVAEKEEARTRIPLPDYFAPTDEEDAPDYPT